MLVYGIAATTRTVTVATSAITGRRMTWATIRHQTPRWSVPSWDRRPKTGTRSASIRSPSRLRMAGSSVSAAMTATSTARIAPAARLTKIFVGTISIPTSASTTVNPLKSTARLAVSPATVIASRCSRPPRRSSR